MMQDDNNDNDNDNYNDGDPIEKVKHRTHGEMTARDPKPKSFKEL